MAEPIDARAYLGPRIVVDDPTPAGIAGAIGRMIRAGELAPGDRLPTVRELSKDLGVSPATVSHGWKALTRSGLVVSRGRSGTFVTETVASPAPPRTTGMAWTPGALGLDLSKGAPDPLLLPEIGEALASVARRAETTSYHEDPVVPELGALLRKTWPSRVDSLTVVDGALDAVARALQAVAHYGDRVIVENPTFPQFLDLIDSLGLVPVPVPLDEQGVLPGAFADALAQGASVAILQPRAHNPTGASLSPGRARELASCLGRTSTCTVIEDDHSGAAVNVEDVSLGRWHPDRVVHIRSYSKSHGPDLRIAAMSGPARIIERVAMTRMLGPGWTPRLLQRLLYELLTDETAIGTVAAARAEYGRRRDGLIDGLRAHGLSLARGAGFNVWVPVADERQALVHLAANGIQVAPGEPFVLRQSSETPEHLRVTIAPLRGDIAPIAETIALAATATGFRVLR